MHKGYQGKVVKLICVWDVGVCVKEKPHTVHSPTLIPFVVGASAGLDGEMDIRESSYAHDGVKWKCRQIVYVMYSYC